MTIDRRFLNGFRSAMFWLVSVALFASIILADWFDWGDAAEMSYSYEATIEFILCIMFADWWRVKGGASSVYKWITFLFFALFLNDCMQILARHSYVTDPRATYHIFIDSIQWQYRSSLKLLALVYFLSFAIWQRWGKQSTYHDGIRSDMANGFREVTARIVAGEIKFEGHSHEGLVLGARIILREEGKGE